MDDHDVIALTFQGHQMTSPVTIYYDDPQNAAREAMAFHLAGASVELRRGDAPYWIHVEDRREA